MKEGWTYKTLDDICTIVGRIGFRGYTKADLVSSSKDGAITLSPSNIIDGELDFSRCTYINWNKYYESPEIMLENGDIVLVKTASIGKCAVVKNLPHEATLNPQFVVLKQIKGIPDFICYYLKSSIAQNTIKQMAGGVAIPTLSQKKLGMMLVPVPSQSEQQSIVDYLDSAFAKIDAMKANAEKALNEAKALFQASLKEMLEPKEGWLHKKLGEVCNVIGGGTPDTKNKEYWGGNIPWATVSDMNCDVLKSTGDYITDKGLNNSSSRIIKKGEIIIATRVGLGKVCKLAVDTAINQDLKGIIPKDNNIFKDFIFYYFKHKAKYIIDNGIGATVKGVKIKFIEGLSFDFPSLSEQQSIATTLDSLKSKVDRLQENFDKISQECDALKQAILRQVFE